MWGIAQFPKPSLPRLFRHHALTSIRVTANGLTVVIHMFVPHVTILNTVGGCAKQTIIIFKMHKTLVQISFGVPFEALKQDITGGAKQGQVLEVNATNNIPLISLAPTPINIYELEKELVYYDPEEADFLKTGFRQGFSLHYEGPRQATESKNLKSALKYPEIVREKINKEVELHRVAGPFKHRPLPTLRISPIGLVPKKSNDPMSTKTDYRLIHHLSYPEGESLNDYIDPSKCSVQYTPFDSAVHMVQDLGKNCQLFKMDIKSAFRIMPIACKDFDQLGFKFENLFYFDKCLGFGCSISCNIFNRFADFLE